MQSDFLRNLQSATENPISRSEQPLFTAVALELAAGQLWAAGMTLNPDVAAATRPRTRPVSNLKGPQQLSAQEGRLRLHQARGSQAQTGGLPHGRRRVKDREPLGHSPRPMGGSDLCVGWTTNCRPGLGAGEFKLALKRRSASMLRLDPPRGGRLPGNPAGRKG
jgi:hypothetical protein